jgi:hypothetical protein
MCTLLETNGKRKKEKEKICGRIARQRVRQTKNHERVNMTSAHDAPFFFVVIVVVLFIRSLFFRTHFL